MTAIKDNGPFKTMVQFASDWVSKQMKPFSSDDFKEEFTKFHSPPKEPKTYGAVFRILKKELKIKESGEFVRSKNKQANGRMIRTWLSKEYSERQSLNRKMNGINQQTLF